MPRPEELVGQVQSNNDSADRKPGLWTRFLNWRNGPKGVWSTVAIVALTLLVIGARDQLMPDSEDAASPERPCAGDDAMSACDEPSSLAGFFARVCGRDEFTLDQSEMMDTLGWGDDVFLRFNTAGLKSTDPWDQMNEAAMDDATRQALSVWTRLIDGEIDEAQAYQELIATTR